MEGECMLMLVVVMSGLCVLGQTNRESPGQINLGTLGRTIHESESEFRKRRIHIHQHGGETTSENSTNIIREEGKYFLKKLFSQYATGDLMELEGLKKLLHNVRYDTTRDAGHQHRPGEHGQHGVAGHSPHGDTHEINQKHVRGEKKNKTNAHDMKHEHSEPEHEHEDSETKQDEQTMVKPTTSAGGRTRRLNGDHGVVYSEHGDNDQDDDKRGRHHGDQGQNQVHDKREYDGSHEHKHNSEGHTFHRGHHEHSTHHEHEVHDHSSDHDQGSLDERGGHSGHRGHGTRDGHNVDKRGELPEQKLRNHGHHREHRPGVKKQKHDLSKKQRKHKLHKHEHVKLHKQNEQEDKIDHGKKPKDGEHGKHNLVDKDSPKTHSIHSRKQKKKSGKRKQMGRNKRSVWHHVHHIHDIHDDCSTAQDLLKIFHLDQKRKISERDFLHICPAIIYQLNKPHCRPGEGHDHKHGHSRRTQVGGISGRVWGYSMAAVVVISLVGLLGVAVIPIMQRIFYNQLLQFLVAMAVGALTGDAMLHLLPHAIAGEVTVEEGGDEHGHSGGVWKGMCGLAGIFFFFILQRLLIIITGVRNKRRKRKEDRMLQMSADGADVVARLSTYDNLNHDDDGNATVFVPPQGSGSRNNRLIPLKHDTNAHDGEDNKHVDHSHEHSHGHSHGHPHGVHGHSHHDGPMPTSVSAVAWMVILGDGVHNLSDGLAIGAAFASSITGGLSTAIAVFCHELPHEIGDFAVLLKAGMSVKQAVLYNCLSSVLCFIGMLIGVGLGNIHDASTWIFAAIGGMFIYISLVNMIPELTSVESQKPVRDLILQCTGMCVGSGIMLAIAVYETDLLTILG